MSNPFPGMDPFLECPAYWRDFHQSFLIYWRDWLFDHLPDHYEIRIDERLSVMEEGEGERKVMLPDLSVSQRNPLPDRAPSEAAAATLEREPTNLKVKYLDEEAQGFLRLYHRPDATLITLMELLSPSNKAGHGRRTYLDKRNELIRDTVHLVEIDLLLCGARLPTEGVLPPGDYFAYISRGDRRPDCEVYGWHLNEPLPPIRIPLKAPDPDIVFDLAGLFAEAYRRGRYWRDLPYNGAPPVPMSDLNARWVNDRLRDWKLRQPT